MRDDAYHTQQRQRLRQWPVGLGCANMLSSLAESSICRGGIIALLKDITNGNIPDEARQYLLASRLVGLSQFLRCRCSNPLLPLASCSI